MNFLSKMERRFGKYAIPNLTRYIIITYITGYLLYLISAMNGSPLLAYLTLDPGYILKGQVWRIVSWILMPPTSLSIWTVLMLYVYYQLGKVLEQVWGDFLYNFYIFFGLIMTIIGAFVAYAIMGEEMFRAYGAGMISTYYVSLSIFLGFAMTFPDQQMLLFFLIPIKIKYLAFVDIAYLAYSIVRSRFDPAIVIMIICSLASTILFFLLTRGHKRMSRAQRARQREFRRAMHGDAAAGTQRATRIRRPESGGSAGTQIAKHRCAVCGRTEIDHPELEFRFCSRCNGNYEYCSDHLFSHEHRTS